MPVTEELSELTRMDLWVPVLFAVAGFMVSMMAKRAVEGRTSFDLPDEAYGGAVVVVSVAGLDGQNMTSMAAGGATYSADRAAERFGVKGLVGGN